MPPLLNWAIQDIQQILSVTGYIIIVTTFQACHLWMRWTTTEPEEHIIPRTLRGVPIQSDKRFCFVNFIDNEQKEAGDTLIHTFVKEPWAICETRWFYFHGRVAGETSPSTSAIFKKHRPYDPVEQIFINHDPPYDGADRVFNDEHYGNTFKPPCDFELTKIEVRHNVHVYPKCGAGILDLRDTPVDDGPLPPLISTSTIDLPSLPDHPDSLWVTYRFYQPLLLKDHMYLFLAVGCVPWAEHVGHQIAFSWIFGYCPDCWHWRYRGSSPPFKMSETTIQSCQHKIWGIPV